MTDWEQKQANTAPRLGQTPQAVVKHDLYRYLAEKHLRNRYNIMTFLDTQHKTSKLKSCPPSLLPPKPRTQQELPKGWWWHWELQVLLNPEMTVMVGLITLNFATYVPVILALPTVAGGQAGSSRSGV